MKLLKNKLKNKELEKIENEIKKEIDIKYKLENENHLTKESNKNIIRNYSCKICDKYFTVHISEISRHLLHLCTIKTPILINKILKIINYINNE